MKKLKEYKLTYHFVESPDWKSKLQEVYDIIFESILEDWKKEKHEQSTKNI